MALIRDLVVGILATLAATWVCFMAVLVAFRPRGINLSEARRLVPDIIRLLRDLAKDSSLPSGVRRRLGLLIAYLAMPFDLVPDFIPVIGYADDVIITAIVLRSVVRHAGPAALDRHWRGSDQGLSLVRALSGLTNR